METRLELYVSSYFKLDDKKISLLEIPTGNPLVINLNLKQEIIDCRYLDKDRAKDLLIF